LRLRLARRRHMIRLYCGHLIVLLDCSFWGLLGPFLAVLSWFPFYLVNIFCPPSPEFFLRVKTPWDAMLFMYTVIHGVRVIDADGKHGVLIPGVSKMKGAFLANHRSWGDFIADPAMAAAVPVARTAAVCVTCLAGLFGVLLGGIIMIQRGKTDRQELKAKCAMVDRYLFYPEGTRRANKPDSDEVCALKPGGLKNIYEAGDAAYIVITVGKEYIVDEYRGRVSFSTTLYRARHPPLLPADYATFEEFLAAIDVAWRSTWSRAYRLRDEVAAGKWGADPAESVGMRLL